MVTEEQAKEIVVKEHSGEGFHHKHDLGKREVAAFATYNSSGKGQKGGQSCHGSLSRAPKGFRELVLSKIQVDKKACITNKEDQKIFLGWLVLESPWESSFIIKDIDFLIKYSCVVSTGHVPSNIMAAGCAASRALHENSRAPRAQVMIDLIKAGMSGDLAYLCSNLLLPKGPDLQLVKQCGEHNAVQPMYFSKEYINNFLARKYVRELNLTYVEEASYYGYTELWGKGSSSFFKDLLTACIANLGEESDVKYNFPFKRSSASVQSVNSYDRSLVISNAKTLEKALMEGLSE